MTEYIQVPSVYNFDNEDAKGVVKIVPSNFGVSIFIDGVETVYVDLFYKANGNLVENTFNPSEEDYKNGYIVQEYFTGEAFETEKDQFICRVIPINKT